MKEKIIILKNDYKQLNVLSEAITDFCRSINTDETFEKKLFLVLDELITNIISYAYKDKEEHKIKLKINKNYGVVTAIIEDDGVYFNPLLQDSIDTKELLEKRRIGGLGIHIAKKFSDSMEYRRENNKNILTLKKKINQND